MWECVDVGTEDLLRMAAVVGVGARSSGSEVVVVVVVSASSERIRSEPGVLSHAYTVANGR